MNTFSEIKARQVRNGSNTKPNLRWNRLGGKIEEVQGGEGSHERGELEQGLLPHINVSRKVVSTFPEQVSQLFKKLEKLSPRESHLQARKERPM